MALTRFARLPLWLLATTLLAGCQVGGGGTGAQSDREGYFTWVDEQGRVRYTRIPESDKAGPDTQSGPASSSVGDPGAGGSGNLLDDAEYNTENYPDGEALARKGFIRPGQRQPYFTWLDAEGNVRVSYYTPNFDSGSNSSADGAPLELTPASVYLPSESAAPMEPVEGYDPDAFAILGIEQAPPSGLQQFSAYCCEALSSRSYQEWQEGTEFGVGFDDDTPRHVFSTGESPFQLIALPSGVFRSGFVMRLRSYDHKGAFIPSLAFLDREFRPVRVVTDMVMAYTPENWRRRGFLEAWVPAFPGQGERWLLVYTREEDLEGQTVIESAQGPRAIKHTAAGELGIATFEQ
ncbi:MalM family protein [Marinobacter sp. SS5-14b]|uniref:MalM family protein n=1 Tax=Marinobacter sp. SS5-14b TaxID=3050456 RepID=UPI0026E03627|nr:MalM family protein [Marinobacter sp. SS5-14b]